MVQREMKPVVWSALAVVLAVFAGSSPARAAKPGDGGGPVAPVALDSPAWRDLMAQPLAQADTMNYHAAAAAGRWGRPAEATALRDHLLARHGWAVAGQASNGSLDDVVTRPPPAQQAIQAAWAAGLERAWYRLEWQATAAPPGVAPGAAVRVAQTNLWRLPNGAVGGQAAVRNASRFVIALPGPVYLELESGRSRLMLTCSPTGDARRWRADQGAGLWCTGLSSLSDTALADLAGGAPRWNVALPGEPAGWDDWAARLAGTIPPDVQHMITRRSHCRDQFNCREGRLPTSDELMEASRERQAREHAEMMKKEQRRERASILWSLATLLGAFAIYVLVARAVGTAMATATSIVLVTGASLALFGAARGMGGWGALGVVFAAAALLVYGTLAAFAFRWLYRRFFAPG